MSMSDAIPIPEGALLDFLSARRLARIEVSAGAIFYSHRNGETEPPAKYQYGDWWWAYAYVDDDGVTITCFPEMVHIHGDSKGDSWISFFGDKKARRLFAKDGRLKLKYRGRWWGPIAPPQRVFEDMP